MSKITEALGHNTRRFSKSWVFLFIIIVLVVVVRIRLLEFPLERDKGEYAYMGQLILQGIPPYSEAYNMKFPGTYLMYALIMAIFGQTVEGIHIGLMIVNCATILLVYLLARKIIDDFPAAIAGGTYGVLSLGSSVMGFAAHATHFVVLPALGGTLLLLHATKKEKPFLYFLSGLLMGVSVIMKQPGIFFVLFGATYILWQYVYSRLSGLKADMLTGSPAYQFGAFSLGAALPLLITFLWLYAAGVFDRFWFWTIDYASKYGSQVPLSSAFDVFQENMADVAKGHLFFWAMSVAGFICTFLYRRLRGRKVFIALFTFFSFLTICPGFYFRQHYFITLLPAVSLLTGIFMDWVNDKAASLFKTRHAKFAGIVVFILASGAAMASEKSYLFEENPTKLSRTIYGANPFPESLEIARFIESRSSKTDRVAVFGSEPQIFFYSKRLSASGYIYTYSLMEKHDYSLTMQKEMAREVESSRPKFIVVVPISSSWLVRPESERFILDWINEYLNKNYSLVGVADIISPETTIYKWFDDARNYRDLSESYVLIYERMR